MRTYNQSNLQNTTAASAFLNQRTLDVAVKSVLEHLNSVTVDDNTSVVSGSSIGDIPSSYTIPTVGRHERPVVGTFVHQDVTPGFRYRVRCNGTQDYFFDGAPLLLESVGQGYGKRLTFESPDVLRNENYFWSDSRSLGYAFSIHALDAGMRFEIRENGKRVGTCCVEQVATEQELLCSRNDLDRMEHVKEVKVNFYCTLELLSGEQVVVSNGCLATGHVTLVKGRGMERGEVKHMDIVLGEEDSGTRKNFFLVPLYEDC